MDGVMDGVMDGLTVLWAANSYWDSPFQVGANNMARELALMGARVAFVSDPISPWHLLQSGSKDAFWGRWTTWRAGGKQDLDDRIFFYSPFAPVVPANKPVLRSGTVLDHWHRLSVPRVVNVARRAGFERVDLLIVDTISQHFWLDAIKHQRSVVRITDFFGGFEKASPAALLREAELIRRADLVAHTARNLRDAVEQAGARRTIYTPNGINVRHLEDADRSIPAEYSTIPRPRVVYVGALEAWFDTALVRRCADAHPHASFVIIGPARTDLSALDGCPNVTLLGTRSHRDIGRYLWNADVGIIPFSTSHPVVQSVHPIKLYEYIACELPVVATRWEELDEIPLKFDRATSHEEFVRALGSALEHGRRRQCLEPFSWRATAERIVTEAFR